MRRWGTTAVALAAGAGLLWTTGCAGQQVVKEGPVPCAPEGKIEKQIAPEVSLEELTCFIKDYKKTPSLHFKVRIKNVSSQPHRYRVNLFLDDGKAVGGLIPRKGKPPVVKPGEEASFTYPVKGLTRPPASLTVLVKTLGD
ncbi:hypothetical protein [Deferrisoma camini]|uniref:hypothetical protein n=1 Tax=Deferrisoma camini TaxID=1035120 RepID=UPI00146CBA1F|nr:hypothetical protein [Deferrisoma camini]